MMVISGRDFRVNQTKFLGLANKGEEIVLKSRSGSFRIIPVTINDKKEDSKTDVVANLKGALKEVKDFLDKKENNLVTWEEMIDELRD